MQSYCDVTERKVVKQKHNL